MSATISFLPVCLLLLLTSHDPNEDIEIDNERHDAEVLTRHLPCLRSRALQLGRPSMARSHTIMSPN